MAAPDLHTVGSPASVSVLTNGQATVSYTISNVSGTSASNAGVNISVPASFTNVGTLSVSQGSVSFDSGVVMGDFGTIAGGASVTISFQATCPTNGNYNVTATAYSSVTDADPTDNSGTVQVTVASTLTHDVVVSAITDSPDPVASHGNIQYLFSVTNNGGSAAQNTQLVVTLSNSKAVISTVFQSQGSITINDTGTQANLNLGTLAANGGTATFEFDVNAPASGSVTLTADASCSNAESDTTNNVSSQETTVQSATSGPCDVSIEWDLTTPPFQTCKDLIVPVCKFKGVLAALNSGNYPADKTSQLTFYLSTDAVVDSNDIVLKSSKLGGVKAGGVKRPKLSAKAVGVFSGMYLIAVATVPNDANLANNTAVYHLP